MIILGIETSCDETAVAVIKLNLDPGLRQDDIKPPKVLSNVISSQISIHQKYGGVVPEVAAREHVLNMVPVLNEALEVAKIKMTKIDLIAVTVGPGLITSLICGVETARALAFALNKPVVGVNHIAGHLAAPFLTNNIKFPALALTVSGGHTNLVLLKDYFNYKIIGETLDDAAGECFDKGAKMLGLGYPGGPAISKTATEWLPGLKLPRPMIGSGNFDFSFSGLKTALLYTLKKDKDYQKRLGNYAYELQTAIVETLVYKTIAAAKKYKIKNILLSGGVSANSSLRQGLEIAVHDQIRGGHLYLTALPYTTDNAAMIALAGYFQFKKKGFVSVAKLRANSNLTLTH